MSVIISPVLPFPNIYWWLQASRVMKVCFDVSEHFEKMSYRNKYYITGANGLIALSIPLVEGRQQRRAMAEVQISSHERWQVQHWRTLVSVYKRAPYFEHYEPSLTVLFENTFEKLADFNLASMHWLKQQLNVKFEEEILTSYQKDYPGAADLRRNFKPGIERDPLAENLYYQLFSERNGFLPGLSMLDLLFTEGPHSMAWLKTNAAVVENWRKA